MPTDRMGKTLHFELEDLGTSVGFPYDLLIVSPLLIVTFSSDNFIKLLGNITISRTEFHQPLNEAMPHSCWILF